MPSLHRVSTDPLIGHLQYSTELISFCLIQVADLLQRMKLGQYREIFIEQQITGAILSQCTAEVLANELEVASKIHRLRLLQIITGEISATDL